MFEKKFARMIAFDKGICRDHTGKMEGMQSFSTSCKDNKFCAAYAKDPTTVCAHCYAQSQLGRQHTTDNKCRRNAYVVKGSMIPDNELPTIMTPYFRWESFGDIDDVFQAANYLRITAHNPDVNFGWFTKNPFIIKMAMEMFDIAKPDNLIIIGSSKHTNIYDKSLEKYDFIDHIFTVYSKEYAAEHNIPIHCGKKHCIMCRMCYDKSRNAPYAINELLKGKQ